MMQCPVCGYEMGSFDVECERCKRMGKRGVPASVAVAAAVVADVDEQPAAVVPEPESAGRKAWLWFCRGFVALVVVGGLLAWVSEWEQYPPKSYYTGTIEELDDDLSCGKPTTAQRDDRWSNLRGRYVTWSGTVNNVVGRTVFVQCYPAARGRRDFLDTVANAIFPETGATFAKAEQKRLLDLRQGQDIRFVGRLWRDCLGYSLVDCRLVQ